MATAPATPVTADEPILPAWGQGCVTEVVPALLGDAAGPDALDDSALQAEATVLLLLDGLGWEQLTERPHIAPTLNEFRGGPITTVAPSTTATALTSIVTGTPPGHHGIVGYRIDVDGEVLNVLSWRTPKGDARDRIVPEAFSDAAPFACTWPVVVQNAPFVNSGFSRAHLRYTRPKPWDTPSGLAVEVRQALAAGEPFVYAYYDGIDKVAHSHGFGEHYDAELAACDAMVAELATALPRGAALVVTADHGLVDCRNGRDELDRSVIPLVARQSGEPRFRWLHAHPGRAGELAAAAAQAHGDRAWVITAQEALDADWFGPQPRDCAKARLGDVALVAKGDAWFDELTAEQAARQAAERAKKGTRQWRRELVCRHGSLTSAEMLVPLLTFGS